jgi:hypothetical protein
MTKNFARALALMLIAPVLLAAAAPPAAAAPAPPYSNWQVPVQANTPGIDYSITLAILPEANDSFRMIYYESSNGTDTMYERFQPGATGVWGPPSVLESAPQGQIGCTNPVAFQDGRIFLFYGYGPSANASLRLRTYTPGSLWAGPQTLSNDTAGRVNGCPRGDIEQDGSLAVVWQQSSGPYLSAWQRSYSPALGWQEAALLENEDLGNVVRGPLIASDGLGNFTSLWTQSNGTATGVYASERGPGGAWSARHLMSDPAYNATTINLRYLAAGKALAVWNQTGPPASHLWSALFDTSAGWQSPSGADTSGHEPTLRNLVSTGPGTAVVLWSTVSGAVQLWSNAWSRLAGWGPAVRVDGSDAGSVVTNSIPCTLAWQGTTWCLWSQYNGSLTHIWGARFDAASGWQSASVLDNASLSAALPNPIGWGAGNVTLGWTEDRTWGNHAVLSRGYVPGFGWSNITTVMDDPQWDAGAFGEYSVVAADGVALVALDVSDLFNGTPGATFTISGIPYRVANPGLSVLAPADGTVTSLSTIEVVGQTERGVSVRVNGLPANLRLDGSFNVSVPIVAGNNTIAVVASHPLGFSAAVTLNVVVRDPTAETQRLIDGLLATVNAQVATLQAQSAEINALSAQLAAQLNQTAALVGQDNASAAQVNATRAELAAAEARLDFTSLQLNLTIDKMNRATADLAASQANVTALQRDLANSNEDQTMNRASVDAAQSSAGLALMIGILGVVVGLVGVAMAMLSMTRSRSKMASAKENPLHEAGTKGGENPLFEKKD